VKLGPARGSAAAAVREQRELRRQYRASRLEPFQAAVRANPRDARAHYGIGLMLHMLGSGAGASLRTALRAALRSAALRAGSAGVHALLAMIHHELGDREHALESAREAARLRPRDRDYANFLLAMLAAAGRTAELRARMPAVATLFGRDPSKTVIELRGARIRASAANVYLNTFPHARNFLGSRLHAEAERLEKIYAPARVEAARRQELARALASRRTLRIARPRVPPSLRTVIPLARKWGIGDDGDRGLLTGRMTRTERAELRNGLSAPVRREIHAWLETFEEGSMTGEAAAFTYLLVAYEEVFSSLVGR
jgi:tetratricopeptide (TPR) repeat protein